MATLPKLPRNPTHVPRQSGFCWNVSTISEALNLSRDTVRKRLREAGVEPDGRVGNSPVFNLARAIPPLFGHPPRSPKER
ncbi:hypothetical protein [Salinisphaera hydrothermalis]|uniref:hypothetical protein n=1 Tax=Salinisphaera hydrothermalis TaxID=563188 RepID=UPI0033428C36